MSKGLVIIPTYNERENIDNIINSVLAQPVGLDVMIVDDNSPDGTGEIVRHIAKGDERVHLMERPDKKGLGTAYIEGFKWAIKEGYDYIFEMDADFSHNPDDLPRICDELKSYDLVIGSRYSNGISVVNWPISRVMLSFFANIFARYVTGVPVMDLTSGFKGFRRKVLQKINLERIRADGYGFQIEMHFYAYYLGFKVKEIPIIFIDRRSGRSKMSKQIIFEALLIVLRLGFYRLFRRI